MTVVFTFSLISDHGIKQDNALGGVHNQELMDSLEAACRTVLASTLSINP